MSYHPGETNVRMADIVIINKVDTAEPEDVETVRKNVVAVNPKAIIIDAASPVSVDNPGMIRQAGVGSGGRPDAHPWRDGLWSGIVAAHVDAASLVDPRPFAVGSIVDTSVVSITASLCFRRWDTAGSKFRSWRRQ